MGDEAFPLNEHMMKPYSQRLMAVDHHKKFYFNGCLSRARRVVENAFGILSARFRIFYTPINLNIVSTIDEVIFSCCILHNLMMEENDAQTEAWEHEREKDNIEEWFIPMARIARGRNNASAKAIRDFLCDYVYYEYENNETE